MARSGRSNSDVERKKTRDGTRRKTKDGGCGPRFFRLFDVSSLAANQRLSLLYEKLPCLSHTHFSLTHFALYPSPSGCSSLSVSLCFSLSFSLPPSLSLSQAAAPSHQLTLPFPCTDAQRTLRPRRSHRFSTLLTLSIRSFFAGYAFVALSFTHFVPLSLSFFITDPRRRDRSLSFAHATSVRAYGNLRAFTFLPYGRLIICSSMKRRKCA